MESFFIYMKKIIYIFLLIFLLVLGIFVYSNYLNKLVLKTDNFVLSTNENTDNLQSLTLEVISSENIKTIYAVTFTSGQKLIDILNDQANNKADFTFETEKSSFGDYVTSINNEKADFTKEFWNIKINSKDSLVGISDIIPQNNDVITFTLLKF